MHGGQGRLHTVGMQRARGGALAMLSPVRGEGPVEGQESPLWGLPEAPGSHVWMEQWGEGRASVTGLWSRGHGCGHPCPSYLVPDTCFRWERSGWSTEIRRGPGDGGSTLSQDRWAPQFLPQNLRRPQGRRRPVCAGLSTSSHQPGDSVLWPPLPSHRQGS